MTTTVTDTLTLVRDLPEFSRKVYTKILEGLYAEPFFSDLDAVQLASALDTSVEAICAALGHLYTTGLVTAEDADSVDAFTAKRMSNCWIHAQAHDDGIRNEVLAELVGS